MNDFIQVCASLTWWLYFSDYTVSSTVHWSYFSTWLKPHIILIWSTSCDYIFYQFYPMCPLSVLYCESHIWPLSCMTDIMFLRMTPQMWDWDFGADYSTEWNKGVTLEETCCTECCVMCFIVPVCSCGIQHPLSLLFWKPLPLFFVPFFLLHLFAFVSDLSSFLAPCCTTRSVWCMHL